MPNDCPFCQLAAGEPAQHKTDWHTLDEKGIVVTDLNKRGFAKRLLWVPREHVRQGEETEEMRLEAANRLKQVARAMCQNERLKVATMDFQHWSDRRHWHVQYCLVRRE